ncbi:hypothetical protein MP478_00950 [Chryseobacterium sp. WG14]|uniref:hypothetical protein n=1 Tax=unclassified Chryseobacterium TaxID=2593645 RepID=UPI001DA768FA|nr:MULTISPECIES: hypothetical protein [unclassified Chryseobacterium]MCQ9635671.1 hypothetical protein [Chryseobacterium sp. WG23]MCQ9637938.1 hypothetical protein [Chryseobacterium sp. WG14]CAH0290100.1 hypothetical protein SRABI04_04314 [Chryseobacterium sp. Bi04]
MKYVLYLFLLSTLSACTKSETQYINQDNKKESVNDKASDTIQTLDEMSDTMKQERDTNVKTANE